MQIDINKFIEQQARNWSYQNMSNKEFRKVVLVVALLDVIQQYLIELNPSARFKTKALINDSLKALNLLVKGLDKSWNERGSEVYGEVADAIRELLDSTIKMQEEE